MNFVFQSADFKFWQLVADGMGNLSLARTNTGVALPWILNSPGGIFYQLGASNGGALTRTSVSASGHPKLFIESSLTVGWYITVADDSTLSTAAFVSPLTSMCQFVLQDSNGILWLLGVDNNGRLTTTVSPAGTPATIILQSAGAVNWQLGVTTGGLLTTAFVSQPGVSAFFLGSNDATTGWAIGVLDNGIFFTNQDPRYVVPPIVGTIWDVSRPYYQPEGPGTYTLPAQHFGERNATFAAGCGHFFNDWYVGSQAICYLNSAMVCCPLCTYLQQIIRPYNLIYTEAYQIIIG